MTECLHLPQVSIITESFQLFCYFLEVSETSDLDTPFYSLYEFWEF